MAKTITYDSGTSGSGTESLTINWGANPNRKSRTRTYKAVGGLNSLVIEQAAARALFISGGSTRPTVPTSNPQSFTFSGTTNAKFLRYSVSGSPSSASVVEKSNTSSSQNVGTTWTNVKNPAKGTGSFGFDVSITIPANSGVKDYSVIVYANDSESTSGQKTQTFKVSVSQSAVNITSVRIVDVNGNSIDSLTVGVGSSYKYNNNTITVNNSSRNKLDYEATPTNFTPASYNPVTWSSSNTSVATVNSSGLVTGVSNGTATITCTVKDSNGNTKSDTCSITVYRAGAITLAGNITIPYNSTSGNTTVGYTNVNSSSSTQVHFATRPWLNSVVLSSGNTALVAERVTTSQTTLPESTSVYVTGVDILGNTVTSNTITVSQEMKIVVSGAAQIGQNRNHEDYTMSYLPFDITGSQRNVTWSFNSSAANTYASITEQTVSSCTVAAKSGADNNQVTLVATNNSDNSINGQYVIWVSYRATGYGTITAVPSSVNLTYDATSDKSVTVTVQNAEIDEIRKGDNFLTNVSLNSNTGVLTVTFPANNEPTARTDSVHITSVDNIAEAAHIVYTQAAKPSPKIEITKLKANKDSQGLTTSVNFELKFENNTSSMMTYTTVSYELLGKNSGGSRTIRAQGSIQDLNIEVWAEGATRVFTISDITSTGVTSTYTLDVTATLSGATGSASDAYEGDGTDVINA